MGKLSGTIWKTVGNFRNVALIQPNVDTTDSVIPVKYSVLFVCISVLSVIDFDLIKLRPAPESISIVMFAILIIGESSCSVILIGFLVCVVQGWCLYFWILLLPQGGSVSFLDHFLSLGLFLQNNLVFRGPIFYNRSTILCC